MAFPPAPNCTVTVYDRPPTDPMRVVVATDVPVRQLKPWGPLGVDQTSTSLLGFLFRWVVFSYVPLIQHTSLLPPQRFYAKIDGDVDPGYYTGDWSQNVFDADTGEIAYTYMVLTHVVSVGP